MGPGWRKAEYAVSRLIPGEPSPGRNDLCGEVREGLRGRRGGDELEETFSDETALADELDGF